jgi:phosphatidylinositol N-acetylglucosaminyltransferase subunit C
MDDTHVYCPWDGKKYSSDRCALCGKERHVKKPQWKKILYERQPFDDTYVDENFLNSLTTKENTKKYDFWSLVNSTVEIALALNSMILFLVFNEIAQMEYISDSVLLVFGFSVLAIGYVIHILLTPAEERSLTPVRMGLLLLGILHTLCPVLASINKNYANDTIYLMTFVFLTLHLVFYDYSFVKKVLTKDKKLSPDVKSMNFALIAALLLSSRLSTLSYVYFLLSFGFL